MRKTIAIFASILFFIMTCGLTFEASAQVAEIESVQVAQQIAADNAGVEWVEGATAPSLNGQVALPVIDEATGQIVGYLVGTKENLVAALEGAGFAEVAAAVGAAEAGAVAGTTVFGGIGVGTVTTGAVILAGGIALAISAGGGGGSSTPSHH